MRMRRVAVFVCVAVMIGIGGWMGQAIYTDLAALRDAEAMIQEQQKIKMEVKEERRKLREKTDKAMEAMKALPDSLAASRSGMALDMSFLAGKEQRIIDQKEWRADRRLEFQTKRRDTMKKKLTKWGGGLAAAELILAVAVFVLARRPAGQSAA
jgi:vacuolar-type H+-ATPase subunit I/STV1